MKALQAFWKTVQASRAMAKIFKGARWVVQMFEKLGLMFKRIGGTMGRMFDEVMEFFRGIFKWGEETPKGAIDDTSKVLKDDVHVPKDDHLPDTSPDKPKTKTKGDPEEQLSDKGKNYPSPLTSDELAKVNKWQDVRNKYLKKWREKDFSKNSEKVRELLTKKPNPDNSIRNSMTPDDLAAVLKEKRGVKILDEAGNAYDHVQEAQQAIQSIINKINDIQKVLGETQKWKLTAEDVLLLQEKLGDLSNLKLSYTQFIF